MQAHPEARSLRVKTLPDYGKLCIIFGAKGTDTRYLYLAHNAHLTRELPTLIAGFFFTLLATVSHYRGQHRLVDC